LPKPFIALTDSNETLLQATLRRVARTPELQSPVIVCCAGHERLVREQAASVFPEKLTLLLEPEARGTAPSLCAAALLVEQLAGPNAVLLALPSDHAIETGSAFEKAVASGAELASGGHLVTFAVRPREAATAYGYLKIGEPISAPRQQFHVEAFIEKPLREKAQQLFQSNDYAWNSGIFMFEAARLIKAFEQLHPNILAACQKALPESTSYSVILDTTAFAAASSISIDYAIMEKAGNIAAVFADFGWWDLGDWNAVWQEADKDEASVAARGRVLVLDCKGSLIQSDGPVVLGLGLEDMIVVATGDAVLVAPRSRAQEVRRAAAELSAAPPPSGALKPAPRESGDSASELPDQASEALLT